MHLFKFFNSFGIVKLLINAGSVSALFAIMLPDLSHAYIGPGAGFAVISSFLVIILTIGVAFLTMLIWPFRALLISIRRRKTRKGRKVNRVVVIGLDGLAPTLLQKYMRQGLLPNFKRLKDTGSFRALKTTLPPISPVAWSTFSTGVNPGKHRIFDFYTRDPETYLPILSSTMISSFKKSYGWGPVQFSRKIKKPVFLRKSISFWTLMGKYGIFSSVLRVPISYPPEKFYGTCLSAMCAPDLRGTQGAFTCFTSETLDKRHDSGLTEGSFVPISLNNGRFLFKIPGPPSSDRNPWLSYPVKGEISEEKDQICLLLKDQRIRLIIGQYSGWIRLTFQKGFRRISGKVRFYLIQVEPVLRIYMTPINIDPEKPALPVSYPVSFSMALAKLYGTFSTLGLSEDTWALNERVIDEKAFLDQTYDIYEDRKMHLFDALKKNKKGLVISVFDISDRIQHMFFRYLDKTHPANADKESELHKKAIQELYSRMDDLIEEVLKKLKKNDLLMVISDHGFAQFKWGINLNTWLRQEGYLVLKEDADLEEKWLKSVDWKRTRAYALGLAGIFINRIDREKLGIINPGQEQLELQLEIKQKLESLIDENNGKKPVRRALLAQKNLKGPYVKEAPDLIIGYNRGYRVSWNSAVGIIGPELIENNTKSWSGDHSIDPELVPGVFFSNWCLKNRFPSIEDLAPTILNLYGIPKQSFHDGRILDLRPPGI
jgi:predicted AlkP superfamily phosphohydrolase/phosphomutase